MPNRPPRLDLFHEQYAQPLFFVTFNTHHRAKLLATNAVHERFIAFAHEAKNRNIAVGRYVIMPDHVHLFVTGNQDFVLEKWIGMLRRCLSSTIAAPLPHWQEGFSDRVLRHDESYAQKWEYVRENPVRAGLCGGPDEWPYLGEIVLIDRA